MGQKKNLCAHGASMRDAEEKPQTNKQNIFYQINAVGKQKAGMGHDGKRKES